VLIAATCSSGTGTMRARTVIRGMSRRPSGINLGNPGSPKSGARLRAPPTAPTLLQRAASSLSFSTHPSVTVTIRSERSFGEALFGFLMPETGFSRISTFGCGQIISHSVGSSRGSLCLLFDARCFSTLEKRFFRLPSSDETSLAVVVAALFRIGISFELCSGQTCIDQPTLTQNKSVHRTSASNQSLEPTAGCCTEKLKDDL
jgi:hypothetical protein